MICEECDAPSLVDGRGETVCSQCGLVLEETQFDMSLPVSTSGEVEGYGPPSVVGIGATLSTRLMNESHDGSGNVINEATRERMKRLAWLNAHTTRKKDRSIRRLMMMATDTCKKLGLGDSIRDRTLVLAKQAYEKNVLHNQEFSLLVGGSVLIATQEAGTYLSPERVLQFITVGRKRPLKQINGAYKDIKKALALYDAHPSPRALLPLAVEALKLGPEVQGTALRILDGMKIHHRPQVSVAAAIYVATSLAGLSISQVAVAKACGTSDVSLRNKLKTEGLNTSGE